MGQAALRRLNEQIEAVAVGGPRSGTGGVAVPQATVPMRATPSLNDFELHSIRDTGREVGRGSYATVNEFDFRGLKCVGKRIHHGLIEDATTEEKVRMLSDFLRECKLMSQLHHPCIVQFLGLHLKEEYPVLVIEYLHSTLSACLDNYGILPEEFTYGILKDVALGLRYLHGRCPQPIIHRDLSANNILLTSSMNAKISDLGVARFLPNRHRPKDPTQSMVPGTPCYMPPETLIETRQQHSPKLDSFSYGVLVTHMLCGQWPIPSDYNLSEIERRAQYLREIPHKHPLMGLIHQCLKNDPDERPRASEILTRVQTIQSKTSRRIADSRLEIFQQTMALEQRLSAYSEDTRAMKQEVKKLQALNGKLQAHYGQLEHQVRKMKADQLQCQSKLQAQNSQLQAQNSQLEDQVRVLKAESAQQLQCAIEALQDEQALVQRQEETNHHLQRNLNVANVKVELYEEERDQAKMHVDEVQRKIEQLELDSERRTVEEQRAHKASQRRVKQLKDDLDVQVNTSARVREEYEARIHQHRVEYDQAIAKNNTLECQNLKLKADFNRLLLQSPRSASSTLDYTPPQHRSPLRSSVSPQIVHGRSATPGIFSAEVSTKRGIVTMHLRQPVEQLDCTLQPHVVVKRNNGEFETGTLMFSGCLNHTYMAGIQLDLPRFGEEATLIGGSRVYDGKYMRDGKRYFECPPGYGLYIALGNIYVECDAQTGIVTHT